MINSLISGLIQGLTEFLPVSSSGHLAIFEALVGGNNNSLINEVFLHFATLIALLVVFWKDFLNIIVSVFDIKILKRDYLKNKFQKEYNFRLAVAIIVGSIPAGISGFFIEDIVVKAFNKPELVSIFLIFTGIVLYLTKISGEKNINLGIKESFIVGICQALAVFPGISRSGLTISGGLFLGLPRETAVKFSFFLSVPVILGVTFKEVLNLFYQGISSIEVLNLSGGFVIAFISGYWAIKVLMKMTIDGKFHLFSIYCFIVGLISLYYFAFC
ncbi:undecaprenyl-diphosphatase [candidate division KSB1 bacterium]|nr:MAG: undecaprenyl-diphosphatase [candidate division KSB1 bacterium]